MDCIPYINDLILEIKILEDIKKDASCDIEKINNQINAKKQLVEQCKSNLSKLSKNKIEYRLYLYILNGLKPTKAVKKIADENYINDITPADVSSIWRKYQKMNEILLK